MIHSRSVSNKPNSKVMTLQKQQKEATKDLTACIILRLETINELRDLSLMIPSSQKERKDISTFDSLVHELASYYLRKKIQRY